ncbi:MAG: hypothetical protein IT525_07855 [Nitrosomonas sp.]|jgi:hypothetical protein|nr:hypothetical protein [Nitrosomonas sp.]MCP5252396.1 hypothetical protein [Burkholderiales bacterium]MCC6922966.1 hypothetical protein [Nitrosomonas sp.]MCP5291315.1 hypothetical protein [Burkholderiales bacterium]MDR4519369.1 hypothetical protein [Nitrosomonas sp.]
MKYSLFIAALLAMFLVGCSGGEGKPGQYPPSLYEDPESGERLGAPAGKK